MANGEGKTTEDILSRLIVILDYNKTISKAEKAFILGELSMDQFIEKVKEDNV